MLRPVEIASMIFRDQEDSKLKPNIVASSKPLCGDVQCADLCGRLIDDVLADVVRPSCPQNCFSHLTTMSTGLLSLGTNKKISS